MIFLANGRTLSELELWVLYVCICVFVYVCIKAPKDMLYIGRISDIIRSLSVWKSVLLTTVFDIESILTFLKTETFHKQFRDLFPTTLHFGFEIQNFRGYFCMSSK